MRFAFAIAILASSAQAGEPLFVATGKYAEKPAVAASDSIQIPIASGWHQGGHSATVAHVIGHGCPSWVAQMYANNPDMLDKIHSGYHERSRGGSYRLMTVTRASTAKSSLPVFKSGGTASCPNGNCPKPRFR